MAEKILRQTSVSAQQVIPATPEEIFAFLANPANHHLIDGSGSVGHSEYQILTLGSQFDVRMKTGQSSPGCSPTLRYKTHNRVVEYEPDELIAWSHFGGHRWRWQIEPHDQGSLVTETFDWGTSKARWILTSLSYPEDNLAHMEKSLQLLAALFEQVETEEAEETELSAF